MQGPILFQDDSGYARESLREPGKLMHILMLPWEENSFISAPGSGEDY
jgi:hypothetical protein